MTGVVLMMSTARSRNESEAQMASRDQSHQMITISKSPGVFFHSCLGTSLLAYAQNRKKMSKGQIELLCLVRRKDREAFGPGN